MEDGRLLAAIATPVEVPAVVDRSAWPVHVTLAGNFSVDASPDAVAERLAAVASRISPFDVALGPEARFGPERNVPVLLAEHPALHGLHESFAARLSRMRGFIPLEPAYWGSGYRPHATLGPAVTASDGDVLAIVWVTLVSLGDHAGERVSAIRLGGR